MHAKMISAEEFDRRFDDGEDMSDYLDHTTSRFIRPDGEIVDITRTLAERLDREAKAQGVTRQDLVHTWLTERLDQAA